MKSLYMKDKNENIVRKDLSSLEFSKEEIDKYLAEYKDTLDTFIKRDKILKRYFNTFNDFTKILRPTDADELSGILYIIYENDKDLYHKILMLINNQIKQETEENDSKIINFTYEDFITKKYSSSIYNKETEEKSDSNRG